MKQDNSNYVNKLVGNYEVIIKDTYSEETDNMKYTQFILHEPDLDVCPYLKKLFTDNKGEQVDLYLSLSGIIENSIPHINPGLLIRLFEQVLKVLYIPDNTQNNLSVGYDNPFLLLSDVLDMCQYNEDCINDISEINMDAKEYVKIIFKNEHTLHIPNFYNVGYDALYFLVDALNMDVKLFTSYHVLYNLRLLVEETVGDTFNKLVNEYLNVMQKYSYSDIIYLKSIGLHYIAFLSEYVKSLNNVSETDIIKLLLAQPVRQPLGSHLVMNKRILNYGIISSKNEEVIIIHDVFLNDDIIEVLFVDKYDMNDGSSSVKGFYKVSLSSTRIHNMVSLLNGQGENTFTDGELGLAYWDIIDNKLDSALSFFLHVSNIFILRGSTLVLENTRRSIMLLSYVSKCDTLPPSTFKGEIKIKDILQVSLEMITMVHQNRNLHARRSNFLTRTVSILRLRNVHLFEAAIIDSYCKNLTWSERKHCNAER